MMIVSILFVLCVHMIHCEQSESSTSATTTTATDSTAIRLSPHNIPHAAWLVNKPPSFIADHFHGSMLDVRNDSGNMTEFLHFVQYHLDRVDGFIDGENVDALEHFFWGMRDGIAMELGALDGSAGTRSMTCEYEKKLGWRRILIEGNPSYRAALLKNSPMAFSVNAAICANHTTVHYAGAEYVGGIIEFMGKSFLKEYHRGIWDACTVPGDLSTLNFTKVEKLVKPVECIPLSQVLHKAHVKHINFFILDVEGGEYEVLKSIAWSSVRFDVLCIETEETNRPPGFAGLITDFLSAKGYVNATTQIGRNIWFTHKDFVPSRRPGLDPQCFNGARKSKREDDWFLNRRTPKFVSCPLAPV